MSLPVLIAGLLFAFGIGSDQVRTFERLAANEIKSKLIGDQASVSVSCKLNGFVGGALGDLKSATIKARNFSTNGLPLFTEPQRSKRGIIRSLNLELTNFELAGLRVEQLSATIPDCRFDYDLAVKRKSIRLSKSGTGDGVVRVRADALEAFILRKFREIKTVKVMLSPGQIKVSGYGEFLLIQTNFEVLAKLSSPDGTSLFLTKTQINFDGNPAGDQASKVLLDTLNPVVSFPADLGLYDAVRVRKIVIGDGFLEAYGDTKIPDLPI